MAKAEVRTAVRPAVGEPEAVPTVLTDLPTSYRPPQLTLLEVEPCRVYACWELTAKDCDAAVEQLGARGASAVWVLRIYDVTYIDFDGTNAHIHFDVPIETTGSGWYVDLWSGEKSYCAEIGLRAPDGRFAPVCRSNFIDLPRGEPAAHYRPQWLNVEGVFDNVRLVPEPAPEGGPPEPVATVSPGAVDGWTGESHVSPRDALFKAGSTGVKDGEGDGVSADSRNVESFRGTGDVRRGDGEGGAHSAVSQGAASVSGAALTPRGNAEQVPAADPRCPASTGAPQPIGQEGTEGSTASIAPGGVTSLGQATSEQQGLRPRSQVSQTEMTERYEELLAGAPRAGSGAESSARENPGSALGVAPLEIRVERRRRISPSSEGVSSFGSGGSWDVSGSKTAAAIDLKLNAEVVISGRAQPGQTVQVNGRWLTVGADGTFSLRLALPVVKE